MMNNYSNYNPDAYLTNPNYNNYMMQGTVPNQTEKRLFDSYDGFIRGNMFQDLYSPYMANEPFPLMPSNEKEAMLNKVREYGFALIDLDLYLDTHPDDGEKLNVYNQYLEMEKQAKDEYESKYGPLSLTSKTLNSYPWAWLTPPWPWEVM